MEASSDVPAERPASSAQSPLHPKFPSSCVSLVYMSTPAGWVDGTRLLPDLMGAQMKERRERKRTERKGKEKKGERMREQGKKGGREVRQIDLIKGRSGS